MQLISNYTNCFNKIEESFSDFKRKQVEEKEELRETLNKIKQQSQFSSKINLNNDNMNSLSLAVSSNQLNSSPQSAFVKQKTTTSGNTSDQTVYQLHQTPTNKSFGNTKTGYLLKHSLRNRMRKHWLKRKCVVEDGLFLIYHSDVCDRCFHFLKEKYNFCVYLKRKIRVQSVLI